MTDAEKRTRRIAWLILLLLVVATVAWVFIPAWLIMPFKSQTARGVALSYRLKQWAPISTLVGLALALATAARLWRGARWPGRTLAVAALLPLLAVAWFARQNHFEWMFKPLPDARYVRSEEARFADDRTMVMAVSLNGDAAAYPIRQMAYHHIVQDTVGGVPIVATY